MKVVMRDEDDEDSNEDEHKDDDYNNDNFRYAMSFSRQLENNNNKL